MAKRKAYRMMDVACEECGHEFQRRATEVRRSQKLGRKQYCSLKCSGRNTPIILERAQFPSSTVGLIPGNRLDEYSPFRSHLSRLKNRKHEVTVTLEDLKRIWDEQEGVCPFTGVDMYLRPTSQFGDKGDLLDASLDRIDSSKGYTPDNVRWISRIANYALNTWEDRALIGFCKLVAARWGQIDPSILASVNEDGLPWRATVW